MAPIVLQGSRAAILDGGGTGGGYALHLKSANHWRLQGFTVRSAAKRILLDRSNHNVIDGVHVTNIGERPTRHRVFSKTWLVRIGHTGRANGPRTDVRGPFR